MIRKLVRTERVQKSWCPTYRDVQDILEKKISRYKILET